MVDLYIRVCSRVWCVLQTSLFARCGRKVYIGRRCSFTYGNIFIGDNVSIGHSCYFISAVSRIYIGNNVMFGPGVTIMSGDHRMDVVGEYMINVREKLPENDRDVVIEDDVWVGCNVTILKGVRIGEGSVIGAGSLVIKDVPPYTIHVGVPAQRTKPRWDADTIRKHKELLAERS